MSANAVARTPLAAYLTQRQALIQRALDRALPKSSSAPPIIHEAMRYSVLGDGKRIRPLLTLAACEAVGGAIEEALPAACAVELIHAYSLVHDDLPAMDDDALRRGRPSCHKRFGEAVAILAGDALLTASFEVVARARRRPAAWLRISRELAEAAGVAGMIGGQVADLTPRPAMLDYIVSHKTGALITAAVRIGGLAGGAGRSALARLTRYGECVGTVFQWVDDLLDHDGVAAAWGPEATRRKAEAMTAQAKQAVAPFGGRGAQLRAVADFLLTREL